MQDIISPIRYFSLLVFWFQSVIIWNFCTMTFYKCSLQVLLATMKTAMSNESLGISFESLFFASKADKNSTKNNFDNLWSQTVSLKLKLLYYIVHSVHWTLHPDSLYSLVLCLIQTQFPEIIEFYPAFLSLLSFSIHFFYDALHFLISYLFPMSFFSYPLFSLFLICSIPVHMKTWSCCLILNKDHWFIKGRVVYSDRQQLQSFRPFILPTTLSF